MMSDNGKDITATTPPIAPLLARAEVCRILGIGATTLWQITAARELPAVRIRGRVKYKVDDVQAYIDQQRDIDSEPDRRSGQKNASR
jgi:excisionase family DNA binding protein